MLITISRSWKRSGDDAKLRPRQAAALLVDQLLRIGQAASALRLVAEKRISLFRGVRSGASERSKLVLGDGVANADDHGGECSANANYSQLVKGYSQLLICSSGFFFSAWVGTTASGAGWPTTTIISGFSSAGLPHSSRRKPIGDGV
jgi:hypothetical protein